MKTEVGFRVLFGLIRLTSILLTSDFPEAASGSEMSVMKKVRSKGKKLKAEVAREERLDSFY